MKILPRTEFGNPILSTPSKEVSLRSLKTPAMQELIKQMIYTMRRVQGVGLAAPQIGRPLRLAVMEIRSLKHRPDFERRGPLVIVNPKIVKYSKERVPSWEGCLSLPNVQAQVPRSTSVTVEYYNLKGEKIIEEASGLWAQIFQHEIDHLDGIRYVERITDLKSIITFDERKKQLAAARKRKASPKR